MAKAKTKVTSFTTDEFVNTINSMVTPKEKKRADEVIDEEKDEESSEQFTGIFDLSDERLYNPKLEKYKETRGKGNYGFISIYMQDEEKEHLDKLAKKYHTSRANIVRILINNAK